MVATACIATNSLSVPTSDKYIRQNTSRHLATVKLSPTVNKAKNVHCMDCKLNELCFAGSLDNENIAALDTISKHPRPAKKGEYIYRQSDSFSSVYIVRSGSVKIHQVESTGEEHIIGFYLPGELFGFDGLLSGEHSYSAQALDTAAICEIRFKDLERSLALQPGLQKPLLKTLCNEMHQRQQPLLMLLHKHAEERLATFLSDIAHRFSQLGLSSTEFNLPMSRRDIAHYLGMTEETISRLFTRFESKKILSVNRRHIKINDLTMLHGLAMTS